MKTDQINTTFLSFTYRPQYLKCSDPGDLKQLEALRKQPGIQLSDTISDQLKELIKLRNPLKKLTEAEYAEKAQELLGETDINSYGVWIYYEWSRHLVHLLDEKEFIEVRTNRNQYKITPEEQATLLKKKVGVIGLSVGQSIALTLAMERVCGELRLADFDTLDLSNLNRIRSGVHNLGIPKVIIAAREIAEIDPYLRVLIYPDGITENNIDSFFGEGSSCLDLLVEVCDGLDIKIISRYKAKELRIPVLMDTNDRGMMDIERFDIEPQRPVLHGLAGDLDPMKIKGLSNDEKVPYILKMIGADDISKRFKASMMEIEQSITTWPQLASSVQLGGAITTDICRRIFLNQFHQSGRYYIDLEELIADPSSAPYVHSFNNPLEPLSDKEIIDLCSEAYHLPQENQLSPLKEHLISLIEKAALAPSGGNSQPWKWCFYKDTLFLFHDEYQSYSLLDYQNYGSYVALGTAIENLCLEARYLGYSPQIRYFPISGNKKMIAQISFFSTADAHSAGSDPLKRDGLREGIDKRVTNRNIEDKSPIDNKVLDELSTIVSQQEGAALSLLITEKDIQAITEVIAGMERIRLLHRRAHYDFTREIRWTDEEARSTSTGIDIETIDLTLGDRAGLKMASDPEAIALLRDWKKGNVFYKINKKPIIASSAIGLITMPDNSDMSFINGGRALERGWLFSNLNKINVQPVAPAIFLFERLLDNSLDGFTEDMITEMKELYNKYIKIFNLDSTRKGIFLFRLFQGERPVKRSYRKPIERIFIHHE